MSQGACRGRMGDELWLLAQGSRLVLWAIQFELGWRSKEREPLWRDQGDGSTPEKGTICHQSSKKSTKLAESERCRTMKYKGIAKTEKKKKVLY